jgi:hypothetical protein
VLPAPASFSFTKNGIQYHRYQFDRFGARFGGRIDVGQLSQLGSIAVLGMPTLLVILYLSRGVVRLESGRSRRTLARFTALRFVHWMMATCFIMMAISGLNITFGRPLLLPLIGFEALSECSQWAKFAQGSKKADIVRTQDRDRSEQWIGPVSQPPESVCYGREESGGLEL